MSGETLSTDFRLFQLEDRLQRLTKKVQTSLVDDYIKQSQVILIPQLTSIINTKIQQFYKAFEITKASLSNQAVINSKIKQIEPALKNTILKQNKLLIQSQLKQLRAALLKKKDTYTTTSQKQSKNSISAVQFRQRIDLVMQQIEQLNKTQKRTYQFTQTIQKLSYDRIDQMRQMMQLAVQQLSNTKAEMAKYNIEYQTSLNKISLNIPNKDSRLGGYKQLSEQIAKSLPRTQFQHIHLKKLNSSFEYLKDEVGAIKNIMNNGSEYQRYITRTVERIERFNNYLTEHQNRRQQVQKLNFKSRIQKLQAHQQTSNNKFNVISKGMEELNNNTQTVNNNLMEISSCQNIQLKTIKDKINKLQIQCHNNTLFKENHFVQFRNDVNFSLRKLNQQIDTYSLIRGQIILLRQQLGQVQKGLTIMDAKISMLKQQIPRYKQANYDPDREMSRQRERQRERQRQIKQQGSMRYGKSVDQTTKSNIRVKNNSVTGGTRYSVKFLRSLLQQNKV